MNFIRNLVKKTDWLLLAFICLITNQSMFTIKILAILFIYILRPNFRINLKSNGYPLFYVLISLLAIINAVVFIQDFSINYIAALGVVIMLWMFGLLTFHQIKLSLERNGPDGMHTTIRSFTLLHVAACLWQLVRISLKTDTFNPYSHKLLFPYGMSTGDNVFGVFWENSLYNMMVSGFLLIYFIFRKDYVMAFIAAFCMTLVFSNIGTLLVIVILLLLLIVTSIAGIGKFALRNNALLQWIANISLPRKTAWMVPAIITFIFILYAVISPQNLEYLRNEIWYKITQGPSTQADSEVHEITAAQAEEPVAKQSPKRSNDTIADNAVVATPWKDKDQKKLELTQSYLEYFKGKQLSVLETNSFLLTSTRNLLMGAGAARFSSLTTQRMSGLDTGRFFSKMVPRYASEHYLNNHYLLVRERLAKDERYWSNSNWPDCFYNQLLGEYGLIGALLFITTYIFFFVRRIRYWRYTGWLMIMLVPFSILSYLFEPLCVMVFFELLALTEIAYQTQRSE